MKHFNTGNYYAPEGQIIIWDITSDKPWEEFEEMRDVTISFYDKTRDIAGIVNIIASEFDDDTEIQNALYKQYADGKYKQDYSRSEEMKNWYSA